jgi:hypothetical protein
VEDVFKDAFTGASGEGITIMLGLQVVRQVLVRSRPRLIVPPRTASADDTGSPISSGQIIAGALAYGYYVAAALMTGVVFPKFLQDHLFDGFAPAVLVGFLIYRFRVEDGKPNPYQKPWISLVLLYFLSAAVFAVIAAAAVFSSGIYDFAPVLWAAVIGGATFPADTIGMSRRAAQERRTEPAPGLTGLARQRQPPPPTGRYGWRRPLGDVPGTSDSPQFLNDQTKHRPSDSEEPSGTST